MPVTSALTVEGLLSFLRDASDLMAAAGEAGPPAADARDLPGACARGARNADLLARVVRFDALATWTEGGRLRGFAGLSVVTPWRCIELNRIASPRVAAGDGLVDDAVLAPGAGAGEVAAGLRDALTEWWRRDGRAAGDGPGPRLHASARAAATGREGA